VAARFSAVADECSQNGYGATTLHCADTYNACDSNTLAYTAPADNVVVYCPLYFNILPVLTASCHGQDMTTTSLHEFTHAPAVFSPGTDDNAYGYDASVNLPSDLAVLNAETYALYANGTSFHSPFEVDTDFVQPYSLHVESDFVVERHDSP
jgi:deuterolysin